MTPNFVRQILLAAGLGWCSAAIAAPVQADLHLDTLTQLYTRGVLIDAPTGLEAGLPQLLAGGTNVAVFALWPPRASDGRARVFKLLERFEQEDARLDALELARSPAEARRIAGEGRIAGVISLEGAHGLGDDWSDTLDQLAARGLSMIGPAWSFSTRFAGSSGDEGGGLTEDGRALISRARALGLMVDVSHLSRTATLDVCRDSPTPVLASHSSAYGLSARGRNLTDEEIRCVAATGGVIGVNLHRSFLGGSGDLSEAADHLDYIRRVGGDGAVALGSDYDGLIKTPTGLEDASKLGALWQELARRGWTEAQIAGARGENFMRVWEATQRARMKTK